MPWNIIFVIAEELYFAALLCATLVFQIRSGVVFVFRRRKKGPASDLPSLGWRGEEEGRRKHPSMIKWLLFESRDGDQSINPGETSAGPCNSMDYATSTLRGQQSSSSLSRESPLEGGNLFVQLCSFRVVLAILLIGIWKFAEERWNVVGEDTCNKRFLCK